VVVDLRPVDLPGKSAFASLLLLADALGGGAAKLVVVTVGAHEVIDGGADPYAAAIVGASAGLRREYPSLGCRAVDIADRPSARSGEADALADLLAKEVTGGGDDPVAAYRGGHRFVRTFQPLQAPPTAAIREGGAYLLVGSAAGRNALVAEAIAATPGVRLALVAPAADPVLAARLEAAGARVWTVEVNLADERALRDAVVEAAEWLGGPIHGVVCSPELGDATGLALVSEAQPVEWADQVAEVGQRLHALHGAVTAAALPRRDPLPYFNPPPESPAWTPDFWLVESSLAGVLGVVGRVRHAAANALTDAFAVRQKQAGPGRWTSVAWDRWVADGEVDGEDGIRTSEVAAALERVLALALAGEPVVMVSTTDLDERVRMPPAPAAAEVGTRYARPDAAGSYAAPTNDVEAKLAEMWQELLGIERVGIHDDFFGLGGHSLLATQIVSRVRALFRVDLRLAAIFEAPTVARLAELIEDAIIAELEALSDEEVAELVAR